MDYDEEEIAKRRATRAEVKSLFQETIAHQAELNDMNSNRFAETSERLRSVSENIKNTRELQYESSAVVLLATAAGFQWSALSDKSLRFSVQELFDNIKQKFGTPPTPGINWEKFGSEARMLFNCASSFDTMKGPIYKEEKIRKLSVRRQREDTSNLVAATAQIIQNEENGEDEATNSRVSSLVTYLESFEGKEHDLLRTLVDPLDPVQTVENFFDYSYLHKMKRVAHDIDPDTGLIRGVMVNEEDLENKPKKQMVLSFSMRDMDELAHILYPEIYSDAGNSSSRRSMSELGQRHPLHRDDPMYACSSAAEQVKLLSARFQKQQANSGSNESDGAGRKRAITSSSSSASNIKSGSSSSSRPSARSKRAMLDNPVHNQDSNGHSNSSSSSSNSNRGSSSNGINSNGRVNPAATPRSPEISQSPIAYAQQLLIHMQAQAPI